MAKAKTSKIKKVTFSSSASKGGSKDPLKIGDHEIKKRKKTAAKAAARAKEKKRKRVQRETQTYIIRQAKKYAFKRRGKSGELLHPSVVMGEGGQQRVGGYGGYAGQDWEGRIIINSAEADFIINKAFQIVADSYTRLSSGGDEYTAWLAGQRFPTYITLARNHAENFAATMRSAIETETKYNVALRIEAAAGDFFKSEERYIYMYSENSWQDDWAYIIETLYTAVRGEYISGVEMYKRTKLKKAGMMGEFNLAEAEEIGWIGADAPW